MPALAVPTLALATACRCAATPGPLLPPPPPLDACRCCRAASPRRLPSRCRVHSPPTTTRGRGSLCTMRSLSRILLRRRLFLPAPVLTVNNGGPPAPGPDIHQQLQQQQHHRQQQQQQHIPSHTTHANHSLLYDHLSHQTLNPLERLLLFSLAHECAGSVRRKTVDMICDVANQGMARGRPWHALQAQAFSMTHAQGLGGEEGSGSVGGGAVPGWMLRESAYRVFAGCPNLVMDLQINAMLGVFQCGLQDPENIEVCLLYFIISVGRC
ncbi:hypothetical protein JR316_0010363 [Psilocybe cubensis]|uniref:Uncharacterized protein n=5 Tax=Psilocybe cubensis TaxID=181762 RepID=A0A8H7XL82_PSICU|nr:uncharacterized protein JR316_0013487 [Psilocybe cubensis]XP_047741843.1 uncharacterized protein JR316_0013491 [Psilocybe cubensis]XP_047741847.1 uncharacterized protein JR316_0013495 [Psilocybe cubensis]XP_047744076.1 hypothetical protein JR316_0010363 [Psilocybe cubensis]KAH9474214.1 hypothetical protein JR316_0013487 [Psilocybe cubensis]KAH9474218.1 hypothetical protein JR316_0013491 [Psilocybe cubensis]KAH9474222.1 hypothetical protein JR316_0013495 [Psilocybe cubensis]KAH9476451.1 hy